MATSSNAVRDTYYWALDRIKTLTKDVKVKNGHFDFFEESNSFYNNPFSFNK